MSLQIYCSSLILVAFVSFLASASPVPNSQFENSNSNGFCAEYPRLSLCQLRTVLDNAILEIDFLVNGMGTGLLNSEYTTSPIAEADQSTKKEKRKRYLPFLQHSLNRARNNHPALPIGQS
uniref:Uncharacterized protein n=1 Tax=Ditylenchus dipsaci TaxID=166011 RepID=A0A915DTL9_9BILA